MDNWLEQTDIDISEHKHHGNVHSHEAWLRNAGRWSEDRQACLNLIAEQPRTAKECAELMGKPFNSVSGRFSELKLLGLVKPTGEKRNGSAVLRVCTPAEFFDGEP